MRDTKPTKRRERTSGITVRVTILDEPIDFDLWCQRYIADCLEAIEECGLPPELPPDEE